MQVLPLSSSERSEHWCRGPGLILSRAAGRGAAPATLLTIQNTIQLPWTIFKYKCATSNGRSGDQTDIYWRGEQPCDYPRFCVIILQWMFNILCSTWCTSSVEVFHVCCLIVSLNACYVMSIFNMMLKINPSPNYLITCQFVCTVYITYFCIHNFKWLLMAS